jgi:hypothetical protein
LVSWLFLICTILCVIKMSAERKKMPNNSFKRTSAGRLR